MYNRYIFKSNVSEVGRLCTVSVSCAYFTPIRMTCGFKLKVVVVVSSSSHRDVHLPCWLPAFVKLIFVISHVLLVDCEINILLILVVSLYSQLTLSIYFASIHPLIIIVLRSVTKIQYSAMQTNKTHQTRTISYGGLSTKIYAQNIKFIVYIIKVPEKHLRNSEKSTLWIERLKRKITKINDIRAIR